MLYGKQELPFRPMFGKPFAMGMADKITEKVGKKGQVANSEFSARSFDESLLRSGGEEHNLQQR